MKQNRIIVDSCDTFSKKCILRKGIHSFINYKKVIFAFFLQLGFNEEHYLADCGVISKIHQIKILQGVKVERGELSPSDNCSLDKSLDIFISYRRSNGSQLASLLKVHLVSFFLLTFLRMFSNQFTTNFFSFQLLF